MFMRGKLPKIRCETLQGPATQIRAGDLDIMSFLGTDGGLDFGSILRKHNASTASMLPIDQVIKPIVYVCM